MKQGLKYYLPIWFGTLVIFNAITFLIPNTVNINKFSSSFWIGYGFITLMFVVQLLCSIYFFMRDTKEKLFLNVPVVSISFVALCVSGVIGAITMVVPFIPYWLGVIVDLLILVFYIIAIVSAKAAADLVGNIDKKIKVKTLFIKSLTVNAESLMARATDAEMRVLTKRVYEAVRFSDPMSDDALSGIEGQITIKFTEFQNAVQCGNIDSSNMLSNELIILLNDRNKKCRLLK